MAIVYKYESYAIIGACFEVYKEKGCGFLEAVYQECLELEFGSQAIPFESRVELKLHYKAKAEKLPEFNPKKVPPLENRPARRVFQNGTGEPSSDGFFMSH